MTDTSDFQAMAARFGRARVQAFLQEMQAAADLVVNETRFPDCRETAHWSVQGELLMRHYRLWNGQGQRLDPQSGCHHLAHMAAGALLLRMVEMTRCGTDDRPATRARDLLQQLADDGPGAGQAKFPSPRTPTQPQAPGSAVTVEMQKWQNAHRAKQKPNRYG